MWEPLALLLLAACISAERPKIKDAEGHYLVRMSDIPIGSCGSDSYFGLGIMNSTLEKCDEWQKTEPEEIREYEEWKCKHLRVHGMVIGGKCQCKPRWKGPYCNEYQSCPQGQTLVNKVCTSNVCQHDGEIAVGKKEVECICKGPWDGRWCERLTCWRLTTPGQDKRFANDGDKCKCGRHYTGVNCDIVTSCFGNASFVDGRCICPDGYGGEVCEKKCVQGQLTCSSSTLSVTAIFLWAFIGRLF